MERTLWTDERLDERMAAIDQTFERIFAELRDFRADFNRFQDRMVQIGFALVGVLIAALTTLAVTLVVAVS
jgi:hypothetical protein